MTSRVQRRILQGFKDPTLIYILRDPDTYQIRYVGKTTEPIAELRLAGHIAQAKREGEITRKNEWIISLLEQSKTPTIEVIEQVPYGKDCYSVERKWLKKLIEDGCDMTNIVGLSRRRVSPDGTKKQTSFREIEVVTEKWNTSLGQDITLTITLLESRVHRKLGTRIIINEKEMIPVGFDKYNGMGVYKFRKSQYDYMPSMIFISDELQKKISEMYKRTLVPIK